MSDRVPKELPRNPARRHRAGNRLATLCLASSLGVLAGGCSSLPPADLLGAYELSDGRLVSVRRSGEKTLRYRVYDDGTSGRLHRDRGLDYIAGPGFADREPVHLRVSFARDADGSVSDLEWRPTEGAVLTGRRIGRSEPVRFMSDGVELVGRLDLPVGERPYPGVVLVHGSGSQAATEFYPNGDFLAANGIATLTFDKRGSGGSAGDLTFDFRRLARDVVAAARHLGSHPEIDPGRLGLSGYSQGGWVAPLAASMADEIRFVVVNYGMIESPAVEARIETRTTLSERGLSEESLDDVDRLTEAAVAIVASDFKEGWDDLEALKAEFRHVVWRGQLYGTVVGKFLKFPSWLIRLIGPRMSLPGLDWYYDSTELLESLYVPMAWLLAEKDESAPNEGTMRTLKRLATEGKPYELLLFTNADHGMLLFDTVDGERRYKGYAPDYFRTEVDAVRRLAAAAPRESL